MKASILILLTAGLTTGPVKQATVSQKNHEKTILDDSLRNRLQAGYHYDSVKVVSNYKFDQPKSASTKAFARVSYPVFTDNNLNNLIRTSVLAPLKVKYEFQNTLVAEHPALSDMDAVNTAAVDYRELAANFIRQFEMEAPNLELKAYWYADIKVKVLYENSSYVSLVCTKDYFTGGSHDLYDHLYLNYDKRKHGLITLESLLKSGKVEKLRAIAEKIFRQNEGLNADDVLDGYFFKNNRFDLPGNFALTAKGLLFFYDYYEIKPFAAGTTQLIIPYTKISDLVQPGSVLAGQLKLH